LNFQHNKVKNNFEIPYSALEICEINSWYFVAFFGIILNKEWGFEEPAGCYRMTIYFNIYSQITFILSYLIYILNYFYLVIPLLYTSKFSNHFYVIISLLYILKLLLSYHISSIYFYILKLLLCYLISSIYSQITFILSYLFYLFSNYFYLIISHLNDLITGCSYLPKIQTLSSYLIILAHFNFRYVPYLQTLYWNNMTF
jgi:hypothetical protein